ncbi:uncharacterized protein LOC111015406 [Momordica charantia]|uniref:Uncharacterized protein LOC111015406 n=1 Tax=Momordica charantia TaxID=3673 RepID=A0A6J1CYP0_MOMCH|nr:uncharacterized protein LOC111015406 [Momordica charantia]
MGVAIYPIRIFPCSDYAHLTDHWSVHVPGSLRASRWGLKKNQRAESPVSCESSITIEGMSRACRYSPEEKKERIERYRTKRNQRNFNKKIKYACRKSLADSRPRIRGRFARYNDDVVKNYPVQWSSHGREEEEEEEEANGGDNWIKYFMDAYSANLIP